MYDPDQGVPGRLDDIHAAAIELALEEDELREEIQEQWLEAGAGSRGSIARLARMRGITISRAWQLLDRFKIREPASWEVR